jgi:hypothetical protein
MNAWGSNSGYAEELAQKGMKKVDNYGEDKVYLKKICYIHTYIHNIQLYAYNYYFRNAMAMATAAAVRISRASLVTLALYLTLLLLQLWASVVVR